MIVGVAIQLNGLTYALPRPARHADIGFRIKPRCNAPSFAGWDEPELYRERATQGFVDHDGRFLDRVEAYKHAKLCGQLIPRAGGYRKGDVNEGPELYSEDLW